ncbi:MAG: hypothetical protein WCH61_03545, partial [bacterium]
MTTAELREKAIRIENWLDAHFVDQHGAVYTLIDQASLQPAQETLFHDAGVRKGVGDFAVDGYERSELAAYENCGMCTGAYMQALLYRYRIEENQDSLKKASRLRLIFSPSLPV